MSTTAPISGLPVDPAPASQTPVPAVVPASGDSQASATPLDVQSNLRLVIEDDKAAGSYVYKTINPVTGQVVSQIPREQLLQLREAPNYSPGSVINASS
jgi:flagellar protein FlaG